MNLFIDQMKLQLMSLN